ncbi:dTDP-4-dehydrorhamnose reductase [uncultured Olleya sp.]|uniref:dTDP-4-dehydrorhamnose reductase n=1 Tax=uncultured Olleya sp. TaxID=757243 RepID=UPI002591C2BC|nr:dTDP-4-dehydrorhamnose reductase [uncultured Olleya sp.]
MIKILVTGSGGQLGQCLKKKSKEHKNLDFVFLDSEAFDITDSNQTETIFNNHNFDYCINCAAYTAVDNAETDYEKAHKINVIGSKNLAQASNKFGVVLIHISTDFVFNGEANMPYKETDLTDPIGVYGHTKWKGEKEIQLHLKNHYIIRTSWLYSEYKNNFVKTMLRLAQEKDELNIVDDQKGTPTNANDLTDVIIGIITTRKTDYGLYHYSNSGETTWYDFAKTVFEMSQVVIKVNPVTSKAFVTKAKRPKYSVLDKTKISSVFNLKIPNWKESLNKHIKINYLK